MTIRDIHNPKQFFEAVSRCKGTVELQTAQGDCLNLKSTLCQYIALTQMFQDGHIGNVELVVSESEDIALLEPFVERTDTAPVCG